MQELQEFYAYLLYQRDWLVTQIYEHQKMQHDGMVRLYQGFLSHLDVILVDAHSKLLHKQWEHEEDLIYEFQGENTPQNQ